MFDALLIEKGDARSPTARLTQIDPSMLPPLDTQVAVDWSSLNYKDALAVTGRGPVVRQFPMVPGIDLAGQVTTSTLGGTTVGAPVLATGFGLGEKYWGGLAGIAQVKADWLIPLPGSLTLRQSMALGTAGLTAMLCVMALEFNGVTPESGPVVVSGASGGVGTIAVMLLARLGFHVAAMTGRESECDGLMRLGAAEIVARSDFDKPGKPLAAARWAGAIDVAGGHVLANLCAGMQPHGVVAACGLAQSMDLPASVAPFILRGVTLAGIDSVLCRADRRRTAWTRLAALIDPVLLDSITTEIPLSDAIDAAHALLDGKLRGRVVVRTR